MVYLHLLDFKINFEGQSKMYVSKMEKVLLS